MSALHAYQAAFTAHLRDPSQPKPRGTQPERMAVYREIVFNNFLASVSSCFPVLHSILGKRKFKQLVRLCFHSQQFDSPLFREIPQAFVSWLQTQSLQALAVPAYTVQLAHYEWVELFLAQTVESMPSLSQETLSPYLHDDDMLNQTLLVNPCHALLAYDYPVQTLSKRNAEARQAATFLCVYRDTQWAIQFVQLNALSWQLLSQMATQPMTLLQHLQHLAPQWQAEAQLLAPHALDIVRPLLSQQLLYPQPERVHQS